MLQQKYAHSKKLEEIKSTPSSETLGVFLGNIGDAFESLCNCFDTYTGIPQIDGHTVNPRHIEDATLRTYDALRKPSKKLHELEYLI